MRLSRLRFDLRRSVLGLSVVVAFAGCLLIDCGARAQTTGDNGGGTFYSLNGNVRSEGSILADATVVLIYESSALAATTTDAAGNYSFDVLEDFSYTVSVYKDGHNFNPSYRNIVNVESDITLDFHNGTLLCAPAACSNSVPTPTSTIENGKIAFQRFNSTFTMEPDGSNQMQAPPGREYPKWSPDGTKIVYHQPTTIFPTNLEIYVMNSDGSGVVRLTNNSFNDIHANWSPDGQTIVYACRPNFNYDICTINVDGSNPVQLTNTAADELTPSFSPDASKLVFGSAREFGDGSWSIFTMNADGSGETQLIFDGEFVTNDQPSWSPDGAHLVFRSNRGKNGYWRIWRMTSTGGSLVPFTDDLVNAPSSPGYSPDGSRIVFTKPPGPTELSDVYTINANDGTDLTNLTNFPAANDEYPSWQSVVAPVTVALVGNVGLTFSNVTASGSTVATPIDPASAGPLPADYELIPQSLAFDIRSSSTFSGDVEVCFTMSGVNTPPLFNSLSLFHNEGGLLIDRTSSRDFSQRKLCATVSSLSPFVVAAPVGPTAALVAVGGRVTTPSGNGIRHVTVTLTDEAGQTRQVRTGSFGYFRFEDVEAGRTYIVNAVSKRHSFAPQIITVTDQITDLRFTAIE